MQYSLVVKPSVINSVTARAIYLQFISVYYVTLFSCYKWVTNNFGLLIWTVVQKDIKFEPTKRIIPEIGQFCYDTSLQRA